MTTVFPGAIDSLPRPAPTTKTNAGSGLNLSTVVDNISDSIEATETKLGVGATTPARNKALIGGATGSIWDATARKNLLLNGDFRINQRVTAPTTDNAYALDRWRLLLNSANGATIAQETSDVPTDGAKYGCRLTVGATPNTKFGVWQVLEAIGASHLRGKQVSLQAKLKATAGITNARMAVIEFTGTADAVSGDPISTWNGDGTNPTLAASYAYLGTPANLSPTTSWATYRVEGLTVGASMNNLAVMVWCDDGSTTTTTDVLRITDVQLEEGAVCTGVERIPFAQALLLCQRFYQKSYAYATAPGATDGIGLVGMANGPVGGAVSTDFSYTVAFPVELRTVAPAVTTYDTAGASGKIQTLAVGLTATAGVTPSYGVTAGSKGFRIEHRATAIGLNFLYTASAEL